MFIGEEAEDLCWMPELTKEEGDLQRVISMQFNSQHL